MEMKCLIIFFLLLSVSLSFGHGEVMVGLKALDDSLIQKDLVMEPFGFPLPSPSGVCLSALKTCFPDRGFPGFRGRSRPFLNSISSECCDAVSNIEDVDRQCVRLRYVNHRIINFCRNHRRSSPPPASPAPPSPSKSCPFVDSCNVKFNGFFPTYDISSPDCCNIVKATPSPQCFPMFIYNPIFYKIKYECYFQWPVPPSSPSTPPPPSNPIQPPPQVPSMPPSTPPPELEPIQPPPQVPPTSPTTPPPASNPIQPPPQVPPTSPSTPPPVLKPIQPPPKAPPTSPSCAFVAACNVQLVGSSYSYSFDSPDCCRTVRGIDSDLDDECSEYSVPFYILRRICSLP